MTLKQYIQLLYFPLIQAALFALLVYINSFSILSLLVLFLSAFALNFCLHITVHHAVHFISGKTYYTLPVGIMLSWLIGIPFHYYSMSHWNHHRHNNEIQDFTSTWRKDKNGSLAPKSFWLYVLFWPFMSNTGLLEQFSTSKVEGYNSRRNEIFVLIEVIMNVFFYWLLIEVSWWVFAAYIIMVYVGWCFISAHNFGQHIPENYGAYKGYSYYAGWYNRIFVNNGLHEEHHVTPHVTYWNLKTNEKGAEVNQPHLLVGLLHKNAQK